MAAFLDECGWGGARLAPLAGDASFRRYYRLGSNGRRAVLMDAPPPQEDVVPYIAVSQLLRRLGFSAPEVYAEDRAGGFLLIEDFGDHTYTHLLDGGADEPSLYTLAVDTLVELQRAVAASEARTCRLTTRSGYSPKRRSWSIGMPRRLAESRYPMPGATSISICGERFCRKPRSPAIPWCCATITSTT
jgi:hypothetical protein